MIGRRLLVFATVLLGLALLASVAVPRESDPAPAPAPSAPAVSPGPPSLSAQAPPARPGDVPGEPPLRRIDASKRFAPIAVRVGERLRLAVSSPRLSAVQIGRGGPIEPIDPVSPARFDLLYSTPGRQEVRLYGPGLSNPRVIGALEVEPAA